MKKLENFIELSTRFAKIINSIGKIRKCGFVNVQSLFILSIRFVPFGRAKENRSSLIFQLALRVGNEKDEDEADTVGCCSLRIEHIKLYDRFEDVGENVVEFDFLGKDSIR